MFFQIAIIPKTEDLEIFGMPGNQSVAVLALQTAFEDNDCDKMFISANPMYYNLTEECEGMAIPVMAQCARTDLNKRFLPKQMTTTG